MIYGVSVYVLSLRLATSALLQAHFSIYPLGLIASLLVIVLDRTGLDWI
jgi:hypothetical protein